MLLSTLDVEIGRLISEIVSAYLAHHTVDASEIPGLIRAVRNAMSELAAPSAESETILEPAVPIKKSVFPDYIICLEDGLKMKMLKRHLSKAYSMTPDDYRKKWGLPETYPMTAPAYAEQRSKMAKAHGLGRRGQPIKTLEPLVQHFSEETTRNHSRRTRPRRARLDTP